MLPEANTDRSRNSWKTVLQQTADIHKYKTEFKKKISNLLFLGHTSLKSCSPKHTLRPLQTHPAEGALKSFFHTWSLLDLQPSGAQSSCRSSLKLIILLLCVMSPSVDGEVTASHPQELCPACIYWLAWAIGNTVNYKSTCHPGSFYSSMMADKIGRKRKEGGNSVSCSSNLGLTWKQSCSVPCKCHHYKTSNEHQGF